MSDVVSAVGAAGGIADVVGKGSGVLGSIADYWGLGRALERRSRSKDVDAAVKVYEFLYGREMPDEVKDLVYAKYLTESRKQDNLDEVFSIVRDARRGRENDGTVPQKAWLDTYLDGASHAYDDKEQKLWAKLMDDELDHPGRFPKRILGVLSMMDGREAHAFSRFCSYCVWAYTGTPEMNPYIQPMAGEDRFGSETIDLLVGAGLLSRTRWAYVSIPVGGRMLVEGTRGMYEISNPCDHAIDYTFAGELSLTPTGTSIAQLCDVGCCDEIESVMAGDGTVIKVRRVDERFDPDAMAWYSGPVIP